MIVNLGLLLLMFLSVAAIGYAAIETFGRLMMQYHEHHRHREVLYLAAGAALFIILCVYHVIEFIEMMKL